MAKYTEVDYVYNVGELEFRKVTVELYVEDEGIKLVLRPEHMFASAAELEGMLLGFQNDILSHRHIRLASECSVVIYHGGKTYNVELADGPTLVKGINE
jgi:hypothetical protein